jgi:hypothetical protein
VSSDPQPSQDRTERAVVMMLAASRMAGADLSPDDVQIALRQAHGELTGDQAVAEALAAARARSTGSSSEHSDP